MPGRTTVLEVWREGDGVAMGKIRAQTDGGGWVVYESSELPESLSVRFAEIDQRLVPVELRVAHPEGLTIGFLRKIPLGRLEVLANSSGIADTIRQALAGTSEARAKGGSHSSGSARAWIWPKDARLEVPKGRPYPDSFYQSLATVYHGLLECGRPPAPTIAEASKVPVTTVHRWVRETRKRGFLPPATPGKAG